MQVALMAPLQTPLMPSRFLKGLSAGVAFLTLSSCSLAYEVEVLARNGSIVFVPYQLGLLGGRLEEPVRVEGIIVEKMDQEPLNVWEIRSPDINGKVLSSVTYGRVPAQFNQQTAPQKLEAGRLYLVQLSALGGSGSQYFVMSPYSGFAEDPDVKFLTPFKRTQRRGSGLAANVRSHPLRTRGSER